jgi:hypothetical protein
MGGYTNALQSYQQEKTRIESNDKAV